MARKTAFFNDLSSYGVADNVVVAVARKLFPGRHLDAMVVKDFSRANDYIRERLEEPYELIAVDGVTFTHCECIADALGQPLDGWDRLRAGLVAALKEAQEACWFTLSEVSWKSMSFVNNCRRSRERNFKVTQNHMSRSIVPYAVASYDLIRQDAFLAYPDWEAGWARDLYYLAEVHENEVTLASYVASALARDSNLSDKLEGTVPEDRQDLFAHVGVDAELLILTGGPGRGKTTATLGLIEQAKSRGKGVDLLAFTHAARQVLEKKTGKGGYTIQSFLFQLQLLKYGMPCNLDPSKIWLVDEASMLNLRQAAQLFSFAAKRKAQIILVGDADQLPSIECGEVLNDLLAVGVPAVVLTKNYRTESAGIANACEAVRLGGEPVSGPGLALTYVDRFAVVSRIASDVRARYGPADKYKVHALAATNVVINELNDVLQNILNPRSLMKSSDDELEDEYSLREKVNGKTRPHPRVLRIGDPVVHITTNTDFIKNGDRGKIVSVDQDSRTVTIEFDKHVQENARIAGGSSKPKLFTYRIGKGEAGGLWVSLKYLSLAYATTVHKAQGSEFEHVYVGCVKGIFNTRESLYTAMSRGQKEVTIYSEHGACAAAAKNRRRGKGHTGLQSRILAHVKEES